MRITGMLRREQTEISVVDAEKVDEVGILFMGWVVSKVGDDIFHLQPYEVTFIQFLEIGKYRKLCLFLEWN